MAVVLRPSPLGERVGGFVLVQFRGYVSHALVFRPPVSLSTLRLVRARTRRKTRYLTAGSAVSGSPSQTTAPSALARRNPHTTGHTGPVSSGSADGVRVKHHPNWSRASRSASREFIPDAEREAQHLAGCHLAAPRQATPPVHRSGLRPTRVAAWPIRYPAFRPWGASLASPAPGLLCRLLTSAGRSGRIPPPSVL
jgi:hypothetical protein